MIIVEASADSLGSSFSHFLSLTPPECYTGCFNKICDALHCSILPHLSQILLCTISIFHDFQSLDQNLRVPGRRDGVSITTDHHKSWLCVRFRFTSFCVQALFTYFNCTLNVYYLHSYLYLYIFVLLLTTRLRLVHSFLTRDSLDLYACLSL